MRRISSKHSLSSDCAGLMAYLATVHTGVILLLLGMVTLASADFVADSSQVEHPAAAAIMLDTSLEARRDEGNMRGIVAELMALDEASVLALVSRDNGFKRVRCPKCGSGWVSVWKLSDPDHVACNECGMKFPDPDYLETAVHKGKNISGEPVEWHYYKREGDDTDYFLSAVLRHRRHKFLAGQSQYLGRLYQLTGEEKYARRAAVILVALAEAYPHWCARESNVASGHRIVYGRPRRGGVWHGHHFGEMPISAVFGYDQAYNSPVWDELSRERGHNVRKPVEDWFRASYQMILELHEDFGGGFGNLHPYTIRKVVAAGRVLNDPEMIHAMIPWFGGVIDGSFHFDGMWREGSPGYHYQTVANLARASNAFAGYTDPPGYVDSKYGLKLENTNLSERFPILEKAAQVLGIMLYPDGRRVTVHDSHWRGGGEIKARPNIELNSYGHFALSREATADPTQVHLHFCPLTYLSHYHTDRLSMILWAAGTEILPDIGYITLPNSIYRSFATSCLSHNMSYVGWNEPRKPGSSKWARSALLAYDPGGHCDKQVQLVEAESPGPPWQEIETARRLIMLIALNDQRSYVFDLFRLKGGEWHESVLRPSADEDCDEQSSLALAGRSGTLAGEDVAYNVLGRTPVSSAVIDSAEEWQAVRSFVHDVRVTQTAAPAVVTWTGQDTGASVRCFLNDQPETEFILGRIPLLRPANNILSEVDKYQGPYLMRRRQGQEGLTSSFAAVYDAWARGAEPMIERVKWVTPQPSDPFAVAAIVTMKNRTDLIYCSTDDIERNVAGVKVRGPVAVLSRQGAGLAWGYVYGDGQIKADEFAVTGEPVVRTPLREVLRAAEGDQDALEVAADLPEGEALKGVWLRVIHGDGSAYGYRIENVQEVAEGSRIVIHDEPGFEMTDDGMHMLFFPNYSIPGQQQVEICVPRFVRHAPG